MPVRSRLSARRPRHRYQVAAAAAALTIVCGAAAAVPASASTGTPSPGPPDIVTAPTLIAATTAGESCSTTRASVTPRLCRYR